MSVSAPEKFGGLVLGFDHGKEARRGSFPRVCVCVGGSPWKAPNGELTRTGGHQGPGA